MLDAEGSALRALWCQDEGRSQHASPRGDATPSTPLPVHRVRLHAAIGRPWQRRPGTNKKAPAVRAGASLVQWLSRFWRVVIAVTLRGAGRFAQRCRSNNLQL